MNNKHKDVMNLGILHIDYEERQSKDGMFHLHIELCVMFQSLTLGIQPWYHNSTHGT